MGIGAPGFDRAWKKYALAGTALLAVPTADAGVIGSGPLSLTLNVTDGAQSLNFDFNLDELTDLVISASDSAFPGGFNRYVVADADGVVTHTNSFFAAGLGGGQTIDGNSYFYYYGYLIKDYLSSRDFTAQAAQGDWPNDINQFRYLGFRFFDTNEDVFYGWMKISVALGSADAKIVEWAYEDVPDTAITTPNDEVPEPSSMALLAMGAAGVAALKRRRGNKN